MVGYYFLAAIAEIAGCFAVWAWLRLGYSQWLIVPAGALLFLFAVLLTKFDVAHAGRAYAAYGGVYIGASLLWLMFVERVMPDRWDILGGSISMLGAGIIFFGPRAGQLPG